MVPLSTKRRPNMKPRFSLWGSCPLFLLLAALFFMTGLTDVQAAVSAYSTIEAESFSENDSKGVSISWENGGGQSLGWVNDGDYACYKNITFGYGISKLKIRYSKRILANVSIRFLLDKPNGGTQVAEVTIGKRTGSNWTDFETMEVNFKKEVSGTHDLYLKFSSIEPREQLIHIDWFVFSASEDAKLSLPPVGLQLSDSEGITYTVLKGQKTMEVTSIPKNMELWYMKNTLNLTSQNGSVTMKITKVASNAAKNCKKLKVVYFGENITTVSKKAFYGCSQLNTLIFQGKAAKKKVEPSAFYTIKKKAVFYVPKANLSYFKKVFQKDAKTAKLSFKFKEYKAVG